MGSQERARRLLLPLSVKGPKPKGTVWRALRQHQVPLRNSLKLGLRHQLFRCILRKARSRIPENGGFTSWMSLRLLPRDSCTNSFSACRAPLRHVVHIHFAQEDDSVLLGKSEELLFEDVFEFLDCRGSEAAGRGIGQITMDGLFQCGQASRFPHFVPADCGDLILSGQALGLLPGSRLRRDAHTARAPRNRPQDPLPATAASTARLVLIWALGRVSGVDRKHDASSLAYVQNWYKFQFSDFYTVYIYDFKLLRSGGGGGSRTRVRNRCQPRESMLSPVPMVSLATLRTDKMRCQLVR